MAASQVYHKLTAIPLFKGMSGEDLAYIVDRIRLRWLTVGADQAFIRSDEPCNHLAVLTEGEMMRTTTYDDGVYDVKQLIRGIQILEIEQLYGLRCQYRSSYRASTSCKLLLISKDDIRQTLMNIPIFRINLLNLISANYNKLLDATQPRTYNLKDMILHFASDRPVSVRIRMSDLGRYLGASRKTISNALHELEAEGKVTLHTNLIEYKYTD